MVIQWQKQNEIQNGMYDEIRQMSEVGVDNVLKDSQNVFYVLMGKPLKNNIQFESM